LEIGAGSIRLAASISFSQCKNMAPFAAVCGESGEFCGVTLFIRVETILHDTRRSIRSIGGWQVLNVNRQHQRGRPQQKLDAVVASGMV
jgi:hypothetical protein